MKVLVGAIAGLIVFLLSSAVLFGVVDLGGFMNFGKNFVLCSRFTGVLVDSAGKGVPSIRVERTWEWTWANKTGADQATTDSEGRFELPQVTGRSFTAGFLMHEPLIRQELTAHGPAGPVRLWLFFKHDYADNGELEGKPLKMVCGLENTPPGERLHVGTCVLAK